MWPLPRRENTYISVLFEPTTITCAILAQDDRTFILHAFRRYPLPLNTFTDHALLNCSGIKRNIADFIKRNRSANANITFILDGSLMHEQIGPAHTMAHPFAHTCTRQHSLCTVDDEQIMHTASLHYAHLLQYQLLAINNKLNVHAIISKNSALLALYEHLWGAAFRKTQLGIHLARCHNNPERLIDPTIVSRIVRTLPRYQIRKDEAIPLLASCGARIFSGAYV